jgi:hypothetical protein
VRRALQWLERSGLLPRSRLEYGLAGASGYFQRTNRQSVFGTAHEYQSQVPQTPNHGLMSISASYPSIPGTTPSTSVPILPQGVYPDTGLGIQDPTHGGLQGNLAAETSLVANTSRERARRRSKKRKKSEERLSSRGPQSTKANTIPLKRRRLPDKTTSVPTEPPAPVLTKRALLSRMNTHKEHVDRVAGES